MSLSHLLEHIEPIEISGRVAQAVGGVVNDYDPMTTIPWMADASLAMQSARLGQVVQLGVRHES
ncbi:MAG: hypothetical protein KF747_00225 [Nitrospira sp.]|nr:hypothetical protein [Nitrospira sp.]